VSDLSTPLIKAGGGERSPLSVGAQAAPGDWIALLKPRVMTLVVFTALIGVLMAPGSISPLTGAVAVACVAIAAGACGAINMWYDRDIDAIMRRTQSRPIPAGRIKPLPALIYGIVLAALSVAVMAAFVNAAAAIVLAISIAFYVFVYTVWLKRRTPQNIVIGGAAGAFPPVVGWAAVTGSVDPMAIVLFGVIFIWTPPHFWSLALWANDDYRRADVPMLPVVAGARETRRQILIYTLILVPFTLLPWLLHFSGPLYAATAVILGAWFLVHAWRVLTDRQDAAGVSLTEDAPARAAFRFSILYLFLLFAVLPIDRLLLG